MTGPDFIVLAALILLLLPAVVMPWEGRRVPGAVYAAIAAGGLMASALRGGATGALTGAAAGVACLIVVATAVTLARSLFRIQLLTGGHIKLLAAGATWLGIQGMIAMLAIAFVALFGLAAVEQLKSVARRPDFSAIAALAILGLTLGQSWLGL